ncbi:MAG: AAA family ATPase [Armatimonadota bacterium]
MHTVTPRELSKLLLNVAMTRPVFIWGPPGIGKSALVEQFAHDVGLDCVSLLGSQLAPEDLIGVPRIIEDRSVFCPPRMIARDEPYLLFVDELNACSFEVQKAFYSLINDRRLGEYRLPAGSVVAGAGNRAQDQAIVKPMSSALMNRMLHVELKPSAREWLDWAYLQGIHEWIIAYVETRPDHLYVQPPKTEETFTTPRSWHILSDALRAYGPQVSLGELEMLASGCLSPNHARSFLAFVKQLNGSLRVDLILKGEQPLPRAAEDRDVLYFVVQSVRAQLAKELPPEREGLKPQHRTLVQQAKRILMELCEMSVEMATVMVAEEQGESARNLPPWFLVEVVRDLPRLAQSVAVRK